MNKLQPEWQKIKPLGKITCSSYACERDLHCFIRRRPRNSSYRNGRCIACNVDLIDWQRLDKHDLSDSAYTVGCLERELVRHLYWHKTLDVKAVTQARKKGIQQLRKDARKRLAKSVGPPRTQIFRDGTQTPTSGNILFYAQHATATCCRRCIEAWHAIDRNSPLTEEQLSYMVNLIMLFIRKRLPELAIDTNSASEPD